jgi:hypothetical protein
MYPSRGNSNTVYSRRPSRFGREPCCTDDDQIVEDDFIRHLGHCDLGPPALLRRTYRNLRINFISSG